MHDQKIKIALIEDDFAIVQMYRMKFESEGYEVVTTGDGESGLKLIADSKPDVVLLDINMPVMDGSEMLKQLRASPEGKEIKVIMLTNLGESEAPESIRELGILDFIVKAEMTPKQVADRVKQVLGK